MAEMMRAKCETIYVVVTNNKGTSVWRNYSAGSDAVAHNFLLHALIYTKQNVNESWLVITSGDTSFITV